jgi:ABC-2 type transport system permease protein
MLINSIVQAFFMPNCEEFSELIRTGGLDFALLKPIDTQFLISLQKIEWSALSNVIVAVVLIAVGMSHLVVREPAPVQIDVATVLLYPLYVACGVAILYSLMIGLSASSIWLGRNQSLYDFWFYITNFSRYPMEIYQGTYGQPLQWLFTFIIPVLVVVNVPAQALAQPLSPLSTIRVPLAIFTVFAAASCLILSRWVFQASLFRYRSASS